MNIKSILTSALLLASFMTAGAQTTKYLNVQIDDGQYESFEVAPSLGLSWDNVNKEETPPPSPITKDTPVGTVGIYNGVEAVVVELNSHKYAIATMNIGATSVDEGAGIALTYYPNPGEFVKTSDGCWISPYNVPCYGYYFCCTEDVKNYLQKHPLGEGWRLPHRTEMDRIASYLRPVINECGTYLGHGWKIEGTETTLFFPAAGCVGYDWSAEDFDFNNPNGTFNLDRPGLVGQYLCSNYATDVATMFISNDKTSSENKADVGLYVTHIDTVRLICELPDE